MKNALRSLARQFAITASALGAAVLCVTVAAAWTGPTGTPPNNNVPAPVNIGSSAQVKQGGLGVTNLVADQICFGSDCRDGWAGSDASNAEQIYNSVTYSGTVSLNSGKKFSDYSFLVFLGGPNGGCDDGSGCRTNTVTIPYSVFVSKPNSHIGTETFSGDDSGGYGVRYLSDTTFEVVYGRGGALREIWGVY